MTMSLPIAPEVMDMPWL